MSKKTAAAIIDEMAALAVAETKKAEPLPSPASANLSLLDVKPVWVEIQPQVSRLISRPKPW